MTVHDTQPGSVRGLRQARPQMLSQSAIIFDLFRPGNSFTIGELQRHFEVMAHKFSSAAEAAKWLALAQKSTLSARLNRLKADNKIMVDGQRKCTITGVVVDRLVIYRDRIEEQQSMGDWDKKLPAQREWER